MAVTAEKRIGRGDRAPYIDLFDAVSLIEQCYDRAGDQISFDLFSQVIGNSLASSSFQRKLAAARNYGLVTIGNRLIDLTEIAQRIFRPRSQDEKQNALKEAFLYNDVFRRVYDRYASKILPQEEYLANVFADYVPKEETRKWADRFLASADTAGLLFVRPDGKTQLLEGPTALLDNALSEIMESARNALQQQDAPALVTPPPPQVSKSHLQMLIDVLDAKDMTDAEQEAVWTLIRYVKRKEAGVEPTTERLESSSLP
jgi:hypothetical protein